MKPKVYVGLVMLLLLAAPRLMLADITFVSGANTSLTSLTCGDYGVNPCPSKSVAITPYKGWEPNGTPEALGGISDAVWISNTDSGWHGSNFQPRHTNTAIFSLSLSFTISQPTTMDVSVWADDSAGVYLDGPAGPQTLWTPLLGQGSPACSGAIVGCFPAQGGKNEFDLALAGTYTLTFAPYQTGFGSDTTTNPFGLLYKVTVVPDGGMTLMLLGGVLVGLETLRRKLNV